MLDFVYLVISCLCGCSFTELQKFRHQTQNHMQIDICVVEMMGYVAERVENIVGYGGKCYQHCLFFLHASLTLSQISPGFYKSAVQVI